MSDFTPNRPTGDLARTWRQTRFNPLSRANPQTVGRDLEAFKVGYLRNAALLWDAIEDRDAMAKVAIGKRKKAVARRPWEIVILEETSEAQAHKLALEYFYNHITATSAVDLNQRGGMRLLLKQMMDAEFKFYAVHEIIWDEKMPVVLLPGGGRSMKVELRFCPLALFENLTGKLQYTGPLNVTNGTPLEPGGWMITCGEGLMEAISTLYTMKKMSLQDWLNFSEKFSIPGIHGETAASKGSAEWNDFVSALQSFANDWIMASATGSKVSLIEAGKTGDAPFKPMVDYCDRAIACLCRGADLSTISGKEHAGASLQGDETILLEADDCALCEETLNVNLGRMVIGHLFGEGTEPLAYLRINAPVQKDTKMDIEVDNHLSDHGVPQSIKDMAERYGRSLPEDAETLTTGNAGGNGQQAMRKSQATEPPAPTTDQALENTLSQDAETEALRVAVNADLEPVRAALEMILRGSTEEEQRNRLAELDLRWPEITDAVLAGESLEHAMERLLSTAFVSGLDMKHIAQTNLPS